MRFSSATGTTELQNSYHQPEVAAVQSGAILLRSLANSAPCLPRLRRVPGGSLPARNEAPQPPGFVRRASKRLYPFRLPRDAQAQSAQRIHQNGRFGLGTCVESRAGDFALI